LYTKIQNYCKNFIKLDNKFKFVWLMTTENTFLVENLKLNEMDVADSLLGM
jgi:hypothetical protein